MRDNPRQAERAWGRHAAMVCWQASATALEFGRRVKVEIVSAMPLSERSNSVEADWERIASYTRTRLYEFTRRFPAIV